MTDDDFIYKLNKNVGDSSSGGQYDDTTPFTEDDINGMISVAMRTQTEHMQMAGAEFQSQNFKTGVSGWQIDGQGNAEFNNGIFRGTFSLGGTTITIDNTKDIQTYLNTINTAGGGTLYIKPGTYTLTSAGLTMYSGVALIGSSPTTTIINMNSTSGIINSAGTFRYNTGTITSITSGVLVVGSGTTWVGNVVAGRDQFFINGQWMNIAVVTDNTHITLAEGYDGATIGAGTAYRVSSPIQGVTLQGFTVKNSTGNAITLADARFITVNNVVSQSNAIGVIGTFITELSMSSVIPVSNTSHGTSMTNGGRFNWNSVNSTNNGGNGILYSAIRSAGFFEGVGNTNTLSGFNLTNCTDVSAIDFSAEFNTAKGVELVSGNASCSFYDGGVRGNGSDGLKMTATAIKCQVIGGTYENNGGWAINIADSTSSNNTIISPNFANNVSGTVQDLGTGDFIFPQTLSTFVVQDIALNSGRTSGSLGNFAVTSNTTGSILYIASGVGTTITIYRLALSAITSNYQITHTTTLTVQGSNEVFGIMATGTFLYIYTQITGAAALRRYSLADLSGVTTMTFANTLSGNSGCFTDGTLLYFESTNPDVYTSYSISGTTATNTGNTFTYTTSGNPTASYCDGINVWISDATTNGTYNIRKYALAGGAAISTTSPIINSKNYYLGTMPSLFMGGTGIMGLGWGIAWTDPTAQTGDGVHLTAITLP